MVTNVTSLLKTVKAVEDEHTRGTRALESSIEAIAQELRGFDSPEAPRHKAEPEDLIRATRPITLATGKAASAGKSCKQEDIIVAANMGRKAISDMLATCKAAAFHSKKQEVRNRALSAGHDVAVQYRELLQLVMHNLSRPGGDGKQSMSEISRKIAQCVTELAAAAEQLKDDDWVDPSDPTFIAENELLGAAKSIENAAKKLASLKPRKEIKGKVRRDLKLAHTRSSIGISGPEWALSFVTFCTTLYPSNTHHHRTSSTTNHTPFLEICLIFLVAYELSNRNTDI